MCELRHWSRDGKPLLEPRSWGKFSEELAISWKVHRQKMVRAGKEYQISAKECRPERAWHEGFNGDSTHKAWWLEERWKTSKWHCWYQIQACMRRDFALHVTKDVLQMVSLRCRCLNGTIYHHMHPHESFVDANVWFKSHQMTPYGGCIIAATLTGNVNQKNCNL